MPAESRCLFTNFNAAAKPECSFYWSTFSGDFCSKFLLFPVIFGMVSPKQTCSIIAKAQTLGRDISTPRFAIVTPQLWLHHRPHLCLPQLSEFTRKIPAWNCSQYSTPQAMGWVAGEVGMGFSSFFQPQLINTGVCAGEIPLEPLSTQEF